MKGSLKKRGSKWSFVIDIGRDENNKRIQKRFSGFATKKEAEKALAEKLNEVNKGIYIEPTKETVKSYLETFLQGRKTKVRPGTWKHYKWLVSRIISHIGNLPLIKLKPKHIDDMYTKLLTSDQPMSARSIRHMHVLLKSALSNAVNWDVLHKNVAQVVEAPSPKKVEITVWTKNEVRSFLQLALNDRFFIVYMLALATGMRKGEILGLRWKDIDFERKCLYVNQTLSRDSSGYTFSAPKTAAGRRKITIDSETVTALKLHYESQLKEKEKAGDLYENNDLVVATSLGTPINPQNFDRDSWRPLKTAGVKLGITKIRFHDLRHTHATHLLLDGVPIKAVSERLGHASIEITLKTYGHLLPGIQEAAADRLGETLFKGLLTNE